MRFCTVINCMDGRVQLPVISFLKRRFNAEYVDSITEPGPTLILSQGKDGTSVRSILGKVNISIEKHNSIGVAIAGHADCAGNPAKKDDQIVQIHSAIQLLRRDYKSIEIIGLWVDEDWLVHEVNDDA